MSVETKPLRGLQSASHELALVARFVLSKKRDRYRELVCDPRQRHRFISKLSHFADFDFRYRIPIASGRLFAGNTAGELKRRRSPDRVFVISEDPALDQQELNLADALQRTIGNGIGSVLSCIPGQLAFVETEDERFILERHDPLVKREYIRFVVDRKDEESNVDQGIFQAVGRARQWGYVRGSDLDALTALNEWFSENLETPTAFGRGKLSLGICWFKTDANEHIKNIWQMIRILEKNGIYVKKIRTDRPGFIVYEDEWQLVAEPFRKGTLPRR